jgi:hypothetical protein
MLTLESAIEKIQQLPPEQQKQVFQLIKDLEKQTCKPPLNSTDSLFNLQQ